MDYSHKTLTELRRLALAGDAEAQRLLSDAMRCLAQAIWTAVKQQIAGTTKALADTLQVDLSASLKPLQAWVRREFGPGTFYGDVILTQAGDEDALLRLAKRKEFSRRALFWTERWASLQKAFIQRGQKWHEVVQSNLLMAIYDLSDETKLGNVYKVLRRGVRQLVEQDLLGTTSAKLKHEVAWPEEDTPEGVALEAALNERYRYLTDLSWKEIALIVALNELPEHEWDAILSDNDIAVARQYGVKEETVRQWRTRVKNKLLSVI